MSDLEVLEAKLRAQPDDWPSWLVYADHLTDMGDVRGQLIGLEHRLEVEALPEAEQQAVQGQIHGLLQAHQDGWLSGWDRPEGTKLEWRHGFVCGVKFQRGGVMGALEALVAHGAARFLTSLDLGHTGLGPEGVAVLARSRSLGTLTALSLFRNNLGPEGAAALARSEALPSLTALELSVNNIGDEGATRLAHSEVLRRLAVLDLAENRIGPVGVAALARSSLLGALTRLDLGYNPVGDEGAALLARSERLPSLTELHLDFARIGDEGARALARSTLCSLTRLTVQGNHISAAGLEGMACRAPLLPAHAGD